MAGASGPIGGPHTALCQRNPPAKLGSINKQYKPRVRGDAHWAMSRPQRWRWLKACQKTANSQPPPLMK